MWSSAEEADPANAQENETNKRSNFLQNNNGEMAPPEYNNVEQESQQQQRQQQQLNTNTRRRSLSVPCRNEATSNNVETVVTKAKRAASYLWMLLHAQNCTVGANRCAYAGCADAKLVHLHLKTCPAQQDFPCPTRHNGCLQARKLLAHYRRCRQIRARQVGQAPSMKSQHVCLICSMVARQARSLLDNNQSSQKTSSPPGPVHKKKNNNASCSISGNRQVVTSFTVSANITPEGGLQFMPTKNAPGGGSRNTKLFSSLTLSTTSANDDPTKPVFPPKQASDEPEMMDWKMPPPAPRTPHSAPASPLEAENAALKGKTINFPPRPLPGLTRKRSESLDEPSASGGRRSDGSRGVRFAPRPEFFEGKNDNIGVSTDLLLAVELEGRGEENKGPGFSLLPRGRARSASCHVLSTPASRPPDSPSCGTIYEEIVGPSASSDQVYEYSSYPHGHQSS